MVTLKELMISDKDLKEAWYNIGRYKLSDASIKPAEGYCGTEYPLYLTGISNIFSLQYIRSYKVL